MNLQSLVVIVLRLIALKFLLHIVLQVATQATVRGGFPDSPPFGNPFHAGYVVVVVGFITGSLMLWMLALPIAQVVTRGLPEEVSLGGLSRVDCYCVVFIGVGLWLSAAYFAPVLNWAHYLLRVGAEGGAPAEDVVSQVNGYDISASVIPFVLGIVLFMNGRKWARCLAERDERNERAEAAKAAAPDEGAK